MGHSPQTGHRPKCHVNLSSPDPPPSLHGTRTEGLTTSAGQMRERRLPERKCVSQSHDCKWWTSHRTQNLGSSSTSLSGTNWQRPRRSLMTPRFAGSLSFPTRPVEERLPPLSKNQESARNPLGPGEQSPNFCAPTDSSVFPFAP